MADRTDHPGRRWVIEHNLHTSLLSTNERRALRDEACSLFGASLRTIQQWENDVRNGIVARQPRSDSGSFRFVEPTIADHIRLQVRNRGVRSVRIIHREIEEAFGDQAPCYNTVRAFVKAVEQEHRASEVRFVQPLEFRFPLDRCEVDFSLGDFFVSEPSLNDGRPFRPILSAMIDCHSRCILWACYTILADSQVYGTLIYNGIRPKQNHAQWPMHGSPIQVQADWGKVFTGKFAAEMLSRLSIQSNFGHPYRPEEKGRMERWFQTTHRGFEDRLPGWCGKDNKGPNSVDPPKTFRRDGRGQWLDPRPLGARTGPGPLLSLAEANELLRAWIIGDYHQAFHSGLRCSPQEAWHAGLLSAGAERVQARLNYNPGLLDEVCLYLKQERVVRGGKVQLWRLSYVHGNLADYEGLRVDVRYLPDDCQSVHVFRNGRRICEAEVVGNVLIDPNDPSFRKRDEIYRAEAQRLRNRQGVIADIPPDEAESVIKQIQRQADEAPLSIAPRGEEEWVDPDLRDFTQAEREAIANIDIFGLQPWKVAASARTCHDDDGTDIIPLYTSAASPQSHEEELSWGDFTIDAPTDTADTPAYRRRAEADEADGATPRAAGGDQ